MCKEFQCLECSQMEINELRKTIETQSKILDFYKTNAQAWKEYAEHQEYCAECAFDVDTCDAGILLKSIANVSIDDVISFSEEESARYALRNEGLT